MQGVLREQSRHRSDGDLAKGFYYRPTIFGDVEPGMRIAQEEIFGPTLSLIRFRDEAEAISISNGIRYGLSSSIFTRDVNRAFRAMRDLEAGITYVNAGTIGAEVQLQQRAPLALEVSGALPGHHPLVRVARHGVLDVRVGDLLADRPRVGDVAATGGVDQAADPAPAVAGLPPAGHSEPVAVARAVAAAVRDDAELRRARTFGDRVELRLVMLSAG
jgi:hypothetical protein